MPRLNRVVSTSALGTSAEHTTIQNLIGALADAPSATGSVLARLSHMLRGTLNLPVSHPALALGVDLTSGGVAWTLGAWTQLVAAGVIGDSLLVGLLFDSFNQQIDEIEAEIGEGNVGVESTVWRSPYALATAASGSFGWLVDPPRRLTTNARLSGRCATEIATRTQRVKIVTIPYPL